MGLVHNMGTIKLLSDELQLLMDSYSDEDHRDGFYISLSNRELQYIIDEIRSLEEDSDWARSHR